VAADSDSPLDSVYERGQPQRQPQKPSNSKSLAKTVLAKPSTADSRLINRGKINNANGNLSLLSGPQANGQWTVDPGWRTLAIGHRTTDYHDEEDRNPNPAGGCGDSSRQCTGKIEFLRKVLC